LQYALFCSTYHIYHSKHSIYISKSKNRSDRYAILSEKAYGLLPTYIRKFHPSATKDDWLFPGQKSGCHICEQSVYAAFKKQLAALGWDPATYTLHSLRHYVECFKMVSVRKIA